MFGFVVQLSKDRPKPKRRLDTPHIVLSPIPPRDLFLTYRHALPRHPHDRHSIDIVLLKAYLQLAEMPFRPLLKPPFLA